MKLMKTSNIERRTSNIESVRGQVAGFRRSMFDVRCSMFPSLVTRHPSRAGFTMIEIALCLAIIGFAVVSIMLVLPWGMTAQRDTRQETIINQDASMLLEAIRTGARGMDDLTNYVYAITNNFAFYGSDGAFISAHNWGYTYTSATRDGGPDTLAMHLTNGLRIVGLLSTAEYTSGSDLDIRANNSAAGQPLINPFGVAYTSNHITAYVRSFSGLAAEKPPQDNGDVQGLSFTYRLHVVNAPMPLDTNLFQAQWQSSQSYPPGSVVFMPWNFWRAAVGTSPGEAPGQSLKWVRVPSFALEQAQNQRELRLLFQWPLLPSGVGGGKQTFRSTIAGDLVATNYTAFFPKIQKMYFYQPQSFITNAP